MKSWIKRGITICLAVALLSTQGIMALEIPQESLVLQSPAGMTVGLDGSIYIVDQYRNQIYQWDEGMLTLIAGVDIGISDYPSGTTTHQDGGASGALFYHPQDIEAYGNLIYVADTQNSAIRQVISGQVRTLLDVSDGLELPTSIAIDAQGNLYIADGGTGGIFFYNQQTATLSNYATGFVCPTDITPLSDGSLLVVDSGAHQIKSVALDGSVSVVAGQYTLEDGVYIGGYADGTTEEAIFQNPRSILVDGDTYYITDLGNSAVRKISDGVVSTLTKYDPWNETVYPIEPYDMVLLGDTLYVSDTMGSMLFGFSVALFEDVSSMDYYYDAVKWVVANDITVGHSDGTFHPNDSCTRAQAVTFLYRAAGEPEVTGENPFSDVNADAYYYNAVLWAVEMGITAGTSEIAFSPDAVCSRSQIVTFMYRAAGEPDVTSDCDFNDVSADAYYYNAVLWAVENGITSGTTTTTFAPNSDCTRGQIVTFLYRGMAE